MVAFPVCTVAGRTCSELVLAQRCLDRIMWAARQAQHILSNVCHIFRCTHCRSHWRHHTSTAICNGGTDDGRITTTQPVVVGQVREAFATTRIGAVTLSAVVHEQALANCIRLRIRRNCWHIHFDKLGIDGRNCFFNLGNLCGVLTAGRPAQLTFEGSESGVKRTVHKGKNHRDDEQIHPPFRQWVVHLAQVAIPNVTSGVVRCWRYFGGSGNPQQNQADDDAGNCGHSHVHCPEVINKIAHDISLGKLKPF